jgi:hypothetical protein
MDLSGKMCLIMSDRVQLRTFKSAVFVLHVVKTDIKVNALYVRFHDSKCLQGGVVSPTPNLEGKGISLGLARPSKPVRHGGPTSSYAAAGIASELNGAHKPPHPASKYFRQGGDTVEGVIE